MVTCEGFVGIKWGLDVCVSWGNKLWEEEGVGVLGLSMSEVAASSGGDEVVWVLTGC